VQNPEALAGDRQRTTLSVINCSCFPKTPLRHIVLPTVLGGLQVRTSHRTSVLAHLIPDGSHIARGGGKMERQRISKTDCFLSIKGLILIALTCFLQCKGGTDM